MAETRVVAQSSFWLLGAAARRGGGLWGGFFVFEYSTRVKYVSNMAGGGGRIIIRSNSVPIFN